MQRFLRLNAWWARLSLVVVTYLIAADLLPNSLLVLINSFGYLPYSHRPGPGWQPAHLPSLGELQFFFGFALMLLSGTIFYGVIFAASAWVLGFCRLPLWALRILATPGGFLSAGIMMAGAGLMIAISPIGIYIAASCGALWGLTIFPKLVPTRTYVFPIVARIALPTILFAAGSYWILRPLLPSAALTNAKIEVIRRDDAGVPIRQLDLTYLGPSISTKTNGSDKYISLSRMQFTTDDRDQVRVLLIIDDAQPAAHTLPLPRTGDAIYRQSHGKWQTERAEGRNSELSLEITPGFARGVNLRTKGRCCSSISQIYAPYAQERSASKAGTMSPSGLVDIRKVR
jgi:hypothetical protein